MRGIIRISGSETWSVILRLVDEQLAVPSSASVLDLQIELTVLNYLLFSFLCKLGSG